MFLTIYVLRLCVKFCYLWTALCFHDYDLIKLQLSSDLTNMERGLQGLFTSKDAICSSKEKHMLITTEEMR